MVSRTYYPPPLPQSHDGLRYLSSRSCAPYERRYQLASYDSRAITMPDPQGDDGSPPRKRIAVACGRCRKRKIRCSGDPGGNQPCHNCKSAGVDQCAFLRVQSQEAPMRDDNRGYDYNIDVSRSLAQRGSGSMAHVGASLAQHPLDLHLLSSSGLPASYRGNGYGSMGAKGYYTMGGEWGDAYAADGGVDYGLDCPPYPVINGDMVSGYGHWTGARQKIASQSNGVYLDSDTGYGYGSSPTASLVHRPAVSVAGGGDSSAYSMSSIAASLASTGSERLLPTPVSRTPGSSASGYRGDGLPAGYSSSAKSGHGNVVPSGAVGPASPISTIADVTAAAAAVAGYASSAYNYANTARASQHHGSGSADAYTAVSSGGGETIFGDADRNAATQGPAVDLTGYTYGGGSPADTSSVRRASSNSGLTARSVAGSNTSSSAGYVVSDPGTSAAHASIGAYHHSSSSHGHQQHNHSHHHHHHPHHQQTGAHYTAPRHGSHHHLFQQQQQHGSGGVTAFGEAPGSSSASSGVSNTASIVQGSHRTSLPGHSSHR
ncbi:unnamed protein product [Discula destructiva]